MNTKLDINAEDYIRPKEPLMSKTDNGELFYGFTYPKTEKQIMEETQHYVKLMQQKKIRQVPTIKNYINAYIKMNNKNKFVIITENDKEFKKQNFRYSLNPRDITISSDKIKSILKDEDVSFDEQKLFKMILIELKKYIYLRQEAEYFILASYIMLSYVYLMLDFFPIIHLSGEAGTGKSQTGKTMTKMSINSSATVSATKSSFFRRIDKKRGVYFMDEKEHLEEYEKELLNGCTYEGNIHTVTEKKGDEFIETEFQIYTPIILACINEIYGATSTRTIKIETTKAPKSAKKYTVVRLTEDNNIWKTIRDNIILFWLKNNKLINDLMNIDKSIQDVVSNRGVDAWKSIINLSSYFGIKDEIISYIKNHYLEQVEETHENDVDIKFFLFLHSLGTRNWINANDIYGDFVTLHLSEKQRDFFNKTRFGKCMRRIGYSKNSNNKKRIINGFQYKLEKDIVEKYIINTYDFGEQILNKDVEHVEDNISEVFV